MPTPNWFKRFIGIETEEDQRNNLTDAILHDAELRERLQSNYPREEPLVQEHPLMNAVLMISQPGTVLEKAIAPSVYRGMMSGLANGEGSNALLNGAGGFKTMKSFEELGSIRNALARSTTGEVHPTKSGKAAFTVTKEQEGPKRYVKTASTKPRKQYEAPKATVPGEGEFTAKEILSGDPNAYMNALISVQRHQQGGLVYTPFTPDKKQIINEPEENFDSVLKFVSSQTPSYPVESVKVYQPETSKTEQVAQKQVTQPVEQPTVEQTPIIDSDWSDRELSVLNGDGSNKDKRKVSMRYLQEQLDLTKDQAAALVGIWQAESGFNLNAENKAEKAGKNSSVKSNQYGIGIGQWTNTRHDDFVNFTKDDYSLKSQLDFAINEIKTKYSDFLNNLRSANNTKDATAYAYAQYVAANERNIKDITDLYARVNKIVNRYRKKHLELYGKASNGFEQRLKFALENLNI